jgi:hypothetical protein
LAALADEVLKVERGGGARRAVLRVLPRKTTKKGLVFEVSFVLFFGCQSTTSLEV